jgi:aminoglycoside phosphotransferase (APT) family kinase protein
MNELFSLSPKKFKIDAGLARQLVTAQFPHWADLAIRPVKVDGWDNRTFRLGEDKAVRLPSAETYTLQVEKEQRWLPVLAPQLPLPIPVPLALGGPSDVYPWHWSVYRWIEGEIATADRIANGVLFARALAQFLAALQRIDASGGPPPGQHNFYRGGNLEVYNGESRDGIAALEGVVDTGTATAVWGNALRATWRGSPVWLHGDVSEANLLLTKGQLSAVIDFGCSAVGDPACDLTIAWTLLSGESREAFMEALPLDGATWARARGWALWKSLITLAEHRYTDPLKARKARLVLDEVLADHLKAV